MRTPSPIRYEALTLCCLCCLCGTASADPMRPLAALAKPSLAASAPRPAPARVPEAQRPLARLVAIRQDSRGQMQALIGDRWVGAGDSIDHAKVATIGANHVELLVGKALSTVHLLPPLLPSGEPAPAPAVLAMKQTSRPARSPGSPKP